MRFYTNLILFSLALSYVWLTRLIVIPVGIILYASIIYFITPVEYYDGKTFGMSSLAAAVMILLFFLVTGAVNAVYLILKFRSLRDSMHERNFDPFLEAKDVQSNHPSP